MIFTLGSILLPRHSGRKLWEPTHQTLKIVAAIARWSRYCGKIPRSSSTSSKRLLGRSTAFLPKPSGNMQHEAEVNLKNIPGETMQQVLHGMLKIQAEGR